MSLLMDALRKAEQARRQAEGPSGPAPGPQSPEGAASPTGDPEIELELTEAYLDALAEESGAPPAQEAGTEKAVEGPLEEAFVTAPPAPPFPPPEPARAPPPAATAPISNAAEPRREPQPTAAPSGSAPPPRTAPAPAPAHQRWAARTVFVAKQQPGGDRRRALFYGVVGLLVLATGAVYLFYYQASLSGSSPFVPPVAQPSEAPAPAEDAAPLLPTDEQTMREILQRPVDADRARLEQEMMAAQEPSADAIRITRRAIAPRTEAVVADGYAAYQRGDLAAAHRAYWETLRTDPNNRNALLGLAAIAARNGEQAQARELYLRLLDRDPNDPLALAGLLNLEQQDGDVHAQESRMKLLLVQHPQAAHLHAALGNLYAREARWAEAQRAYADALALDEQEALRPERKNPDFAFNLAVSLEHLGRTEAALEQYRAALAYARWRRPDFDPAVAQARVRALSGE